MGMVADYYADVVAYNGKISWKKSLLPFGDKIRNILIYLIMFLHQVRLNY